MARTRQENYAFVREFMKLLGQLDRCQVLGYAWRYLNFQKDGSERRPPIGHGGRRPFSGSGE
jgi:hypothetical protein